MCKYQMVATMPTVKLLIGTLLLTPPLSLHQSQLASFRSAPLHNCCTRKLRYLLTSNRVGNHCASLSLSHSLSNRSSHRHSRCRRRRSRRSHSRSHRSHRSHSHSRNRNRNRRHSFARSCRRSRTGRHGHSNLRHLVSHLRKNRPRTSSLCCHSDLCPGGRRGSIPHARESGRCTSCSSNHGNNRLHSRHRTCYHHHRPTHSHRRQSRYRFTSSNDQRVRSYCYSRNPHFMMNHWSSC